MGNEDEGAKVHRNQRGIRLSAVLDVDRERDCSFPFIRGASVVAGNRIVFRRPLAGCATRGIFEA